MAVLRSTWTAAPIDVNVPFAPGPWAGAGHMALPVGTMLAKNDSNFVYIALDLTGDTGNSPGTNDYFWLTFDVDRNHSITPRVDVNYGIYPTLPIRIGRQFYLGPNAWTGLQPPPEPAIAHQTFGPSTASAAPHRIWQLRVPFSEVGVNLASGIPETFFGVRVSSTTPAFTHDSPPNFIADFSALHNLVLALGPEAYPPGTAGVTMGGVGNIPATVINAAGRATTAASYVPHVENAAFGGVLNILGNNVTLHNLWTAGARKYRVLHRLGTSGTFTHFRQTWSNYHWVGVTYVLESFGPDASDMYPLPNPADDYSIQKLLLQWNSSVDGIHQFQVEFYNAGGTVVPSPAQTLTLLIDNSAPDLQILGLRYRGADIQPCDIVNITAPPAPVEIHIKAFDTQGNLNGYSLNAYYGLNQVVSPALASVGYPGGNWQGTADSWISAPLTFPPVTCAYQFRLSASKRVTNGYGYIGYWESTDHVTFKK